MGRKYNFFGPKQPAFKLQEKRTSFALKFSFFLLNSCLFSLIFILFLSFPAGIKAHNTDYRIVSSYICYNSQRLVYWSPDIYSGNYRFRYDVKNLTKAPKKLQAVFAGFDWDGQTMGTVSEIFTVPANSVVQKYKTVTLSSMYWQVGVSIAEPNVYMKFGWWFDSTYDYVFSGSPIGSCLR